MPARARNRKSFLRVAGIAFVAVVLWLLVSLTDTFVRTIEVPLRVELPPKQALVQPIPSVIRLTVRASGWSLLKMLTFGQTYCVLTPVTRVVDTPRVIRVTTNEILTSIRTNVAEAEQLGVAPNTIQLVIGPVDSKTVPLAPNVGINTRRGFQVIGPIRVDPDSVTLNGSADALATLDVWRTRGVVLNDVHEPVSIQVPVSDSLRGVISPARRSVTVTADVQEIAELPFPDVPIFNRGISRDTALQLVLQPDKVQVLVRGGVRGLSRLSRDAISAYVSVDYGVDTLGIITPTIMLPPGFSVVRVEPQRIRYVWRRIIR